MLTVVIKRSDIPNVIQLTEENVMKELSQINGSEMLLEDTWVQGLRKVRTPYVMLVEADHTLSASYISSNLGLFPKSIGRKGGHTQGGNNGGGGYNRLAMLGSCLGIKEFSKRVYSYTLEKVTKKYRNAEISSYMVVPDREKRSKEPYPVPIGFVPGAILRMSAIGSFIDELFWDDKNLVKMSTIVSTKLWETNRRIEVNPNTTYVSEKTNLEEPIPLEQLPKHVVNIFNKESLWKVPALI